MAKIVSFFALFSLLFAQEARWVVFDLDSAIEKNNFQIGSLIRDLQDQGEVVIGLTNRQIPLSPETLRELAYLGIGFTFNAPFRPNLELKTPTPWEGGVLFLTEFDRQGEVFRKWLENAPIKPSKMILFDEGENRLVDLEE